MRKAVFLDRDGTLNEDPGYLSDPAQLKLLPGVREALAELKKAGFLLVVVSNQSGVGRGLIEESALPRIHQRLEELLGPRSGGVAAWIDHYELCLHRPDEDCECRKPKPKLLTDAARKLGVELSRSYMVGDKATDLLAGKAAGCRGSVLVLTGEGHAAQLLLKPGDASSVCESLPQAARWILDRENAGS